MTKTFWETSKRPLFVKNVWVNGSRHAVLSEDDPFFKQSVHIPIKSRRSSNASHDSVPIKIKSNIFSEVEEDKNDLEACLIQLQIAISNSNETKSKSPTGKSNEVTNQNSFCNSLSDIRELIRDNLSNAGCEDFNESRKLLNVVNAEAKVTEKFITRPIVPLERPCTVKESDKNILTERVMQWLDLAGASAVQDFIKAGKGQLEKQKFNKKMHRAATGIVTSTTSRSNLNKLNGNETNKENTKMWSKKSIPYKYSNENSPRLVKNNSTPILADPTIWSAKPVAIKQRQIFTVSTNPFQVASQSININFPRNTESQRNHIVEKRKTFIRRPNSIHVETVQELGYFHRFNDEGLSPRTARRQLHIFMPNLLKKNNEVMSTISSDVAV